MPSFLSTASFSERVRNMSPDEIKIPPEPPGRCSNHLQVGISPLYFFKKLAIQQGGGYLGPLLSIFARFRSPA